MEQPYFLMCLKCFMTARPISHRKQISKKGQYTGIKKISNQVHMKEAKAIKKRLFQRLNQLSALITGLSSSLLFRIDWLYYINRLFQKQSSSGSGSPEGVKYCTIRQMMYSPTKYMSPRQSQAKMRQRTYAQKKMRVAHLYLVYTTVFSMMVRYLLIIWCDGILFSEGSCSDSSPIINTSSNNK